MTFAPIGGVIAAPEGTVTGGLVLGLIVLTALVLLGAARGRRAS